MDLTRIKQIISENEWSKKMAEPVLNLNVWRRYLMKRSFTKDSEDRMALSVLKKRFGIEPDAVRYMDIGANHYLRGSNSYLCYRYGGNGVLVEADPLLCENLKRMRPRDQVLNVAVTDKEDAGELTFYVCSLPTRSTLDKDQAEALVEAGFSIEKEISIQSMTLSEMIEKSGVMPDYLSIDVEGYDLRVLKQTDFEKYPIKVIIAEYDEDDIDEMRSVMASKSYRLYKCYSSNVLFIRV